MPEWDEAFSLQTDRWKVSNFPRAPEFIKGAYAQQFCQISFFVGDGVVTLNVQVVTNHSIWEAREMHANGHQILAGQLMVL